MKVTEAGPSFDTSPMIVKSWTIEVLWVIDKFNPKVWGKLQLNLVVSIFTMSTPMFLNRCNPTQPADVAVRAGADVDVATMGIDNFNPKVWGWYLAWKLVLVHVPPVQEIFGLCKKPVKPKPPTRRQLTQFYNSNNAHDSTLTW
ncbi:hypothetical protein LguiA_004664 [Lonicera macranthoides]